MNTKITDKRTTSKYFDQTMKKYSLEYWAGSIGFEYHIRLTDLGFWNLIKPNGDKLNGFGYKSLLEHFTSSTNQLICNFVKEHNVPE
jgi:hypothetical protein